MIAHYRDRIPIRYAGTWEGGLRGRIGRFAGALLITVLSLSARHRLVLLSIDGLDQRYLRDCDKLRLRIPNLRRLMREGTWANGVVG